MRKRKGKGYISSRKERRREGASSHPGKDKFPPGDASFFGPFLHFGIRMSAPPLPGNNWTHAVCTEKVLYKLQETYVPLKGFPSLASLRMGFFSLSKQLQQLMCAFQQTLSGTAVVVVSSSAFEVHSKLGGEGDAYI